MRHVMFLVYKVCTSENRANITALLVGWLWRWRLLPQNTGKFSRHVRLLLRETFVIEIVVLLFISRMTDLYCSGHCRQRCFLQKIAGRLLGRSSHCQFQRFYNLCVARCLWMFSDYVVCAILLLSKMLTAWFASGKGEWTTDNWGSSNFKIGLIVWHRAVLGCWFVLSWISLLCSLFAQVASIAAEHGEVQQVRSLVYEWKIINVVAEFCICSGHCRQRCFLRKVQVRLMRRSRAQFQCF